MDFKIKYLLNNKIQITKGKINPKSKKQKPNFLLFKILILNLLCLLNFVF